MIGIDWVNMNDWGCVQYLNGGDPLAQWMLVYFPYPDGTFHLRSLSLSLSARRHLSSQLQPPKKKSHRSKGHAPYFRTELFFKLLILGLQLLLKKG